MYCLDAELVPVNFLCAGHLVCCRHPHPYPHQAAAASVVGMPLVDYVADVGVHLAVVVGQEHLLLNLDLGPELVGVGVSRWLECWQWLRWLSATCVGEGFLWEWLLWGWNLEGWRAEAHSQSNHNSGKGKYFKYHYLTYNSTLGGWGGEEGENKQYIIPVNEMWAVTAVRVYNKREAIFCQSGQLWYKQYTSKSSQLPSLQT